MSLSLLCFGFLFFRQPIDLFDLPLDFDANEECTCETDKHDEEPAHLVLRGLLDWQLAIEQ